MSLEEESAWEQHLVSHVPKLVTVYVVYIPKSEAYQEEHHTFKYSVNILFRDHDTFRIRIYLPVKAILHI